MGIMSKQDPTPEETRESWNGMLKILFTLIGLVDFVAMAGAATREDWEFLAKAIIFNLIVITITSLFKIAVHLYEQKQELDFENRDLDRQVARWEGASEFIYRAAKSEVQNQSMEKLLEMQMRAAVGEANANMYKDSATHKLYADEYHKISPLLQKSRNEVERLRQQLHKTQTLLALSEQEKVHRKSEESAQEVHRKSEEGAQKVHEKTEESPFTVLYPAEKPDLPFYIQNRDSQFSLQFIEDRIAVKRNIDNQYMGVIGLDKLVKGGAVAVGGNFVVWCGHVDCDALVLSRYQRTKYCREEHRLDQQAIEYYTKIPSNQ